MIAGLEMKGLLRVAGMDTGRTETGEVTLEVVMTKEAAGNTVVVLVREKGGQEVQTQDVMEVGLADDTTSAVVVEIEMISADETTEEMTEEMKKTLVTEDFGDRRLW